MTTTFSKCSKLSISALVSLIGVASVSTGCSASAEDTVAPRLEVIDQTRSALAASAITVINGTYGGACDGHVVGGTDTWTFDVATPANTTLSVRKNDADWAYLVSANTRRR